MDIKNKSKRPITVTLPGGKKLRLGPGKIGQISPKAANHPAIKKLAEAGTVEIFHGGGSGPGRTSGGGDGKKLARGRGSGSSPRQTGDR